MLTFQILKAVYTEPSHTQIETLLLAEDGTKFPFYFVPGQEDDSPAHKFLQDKFDSGELVPEIDSVADAQILGEEVRMKRNMLLSETDYLVNADYPISEEVRNEIRLYRQTLRDLTKQEGFPSDVTWPEKPAFLSN